MKYVLPEALRIVVLLLSVITTVSVRAGGTAPLSGHVPAAVARLQPLGHFAGTNRMRLTIGLPLRNRTGLDQLIADLNDPTGTNYHHWLTPDEFSARFGPTEEDYRKVVDFVRGRGLTVANLWSNRMLVDVEAPAADVEKAFQITLKTYRHPTENREFYAPDTEPIIDTNVPILHIAGLDNFTLPHRLGTWNLSPLTQSNGVTSYYTGSSPGGYFMGNDFRAAYVPGVTNTGAGQYIAIADVGGQLYPNDIYMYETNAGLSTNIAITNVLVTFTSYWTNALSTSSPVDDGEEALDICMAMSMAPGATILNYEGDSDDLFARVASDDKAKQITLSYGFGIDVNTVQSFLQFLAQGQALSQASGDGDSDLNGGTGLTGNPYATIVGGTTLTTSSPQGPWSSETAWNWGGNGGSGGGISGYGIPSWQQGVGTITNQGSAVFRNYPDVAMPADGVFLINKDGTSIGDVGGTSCASPLWAGFMALVNQQAASLGKPGVGFPNPAIYALGKGPYSAYTNAFHDIITGNNTDSQNPTRYYATNGYDLCTGWGTPRGSNTITALAGTIATDFGLYASTGTLTIGRGGNATTTLTVTPMNGFSGSVAFSITGLPTGVTASFSPVSTTTSSLLTLTAGSTAIPGTYTITNTGTYGSLSHSVSLSITVPAPIPGATQVSLSSFYNRPGIVTDGRSFSGGLDGGGYAYSGNLLGTAPTWNGLVFTLGPANANDAVSCAGQTVTLPSGSFTSLQLLGTAVDGNQTAAFTVTYSDNSTATITQNFSDWANSQQYAGESTVGRMAYRNNSGGSKDLFTTVSLYNYGLTLNQTKTVKSVTLPANSDVVLLAMTLANEPVPASLTNYYNRPGIYSDGVTFTNPATGGIDGSGYAYSANLLTGSQIWTNTLFTFGPANTNNVISCAGQTVTLPAGYYSVLRLLATGVQGSQVNQTFTAHYTDGTSGSFAQSLSDWFTPGNYSGETKALTEGHRNSSDGTKDSRTFYLYGYTFKLNSAKVLQSLTLPNNGNGDVIIAAISLVPNWPPTFFANPFTQPAVTAGKTYSGNISTNASDLNGDTLTFAAVSGPSWLSVSTTGVLYGTPLSANVGNNSFTVSVTDPGGLSSTATMNINVLPAPPIIASIANTTNGLWLDWTGGISPYQVLMSTDLTSSVWNNIGSVSSNSFLISPTNSASFYQIMGQ